MVDRETRLAQQKAYRDANREKVRGWGRKYYNQLHKTVIDGYGAVCVCCGETRIEFLNLDHVNGGGTQHMKRHGGSAHYKDALKRNFPPDYRVLCLNCNFSIGHYGYCPHQKEKLGRSTNE